MLYRLYKFFQPFFPKDTYITWDNLYEKDAEPIDGWTLFLYLQKNGYRSKYIIRKDSPFYKKLRLEKRVKDVIAIKSSRRSVFYTLFWTLLRAKAVIKPFLYNYADLFSDKKLKQNKYIHDVYVNHGVTYLKSCAYYMYQPQLSNTMVISNDFEKEIYHKAGWPYERMIKGGMCRWDSLEKQPFAQNKLLIFFTWRGSLDAKLIKERLKENPDFHLVKSTYVSGIQSLLSNPKLQEICKTYNIQIEAGVHHAAVDNAQIPLFSFYAPGVKIISMQEVSRHIREASIVITDRSSMIFDSMFIDTPVLFYTPDKNNPLLNKSEHSEELNAIKLEKETMYNYCDTVEDIILHVQRYAQNGFNLETEKKNINNSFFYYKKDICKHIIDSVEKNEGWSKR